MLNITHVNTHTHTHTLLSLLFQYAYTYTYSPLSPFSWLRAQRIKWCERPCACIEPHGVSPRVQSYIVSLFDYVIKTVSLYVGPDPYRKGSLVNVTTYVATMNYRVLQTHTASRGRPSNDLSTVEADMYSGSFSTAIDIEGPDRVKWRETPLIQERVCRKRHPYGTTCY